MWGDDVHGGGMCKRPTHRRVAPCPCPACMHGTEAYNGGDISVMHVCERVKRHYKPQPRQHHHGPQISACAGGRAACARRWLGCVVLGGGVQMCGGERMVSKRDTHACHPT